MVRAQTLWTWGSASVAYAPMVAQPSPVTESNPVGVDPRFDATNTTHRMLCTLNLELFDLSHQLLGYFELHRSELGANVSRSIRRRRRCLRRVGRRSRAGPHRAGRRVRPADRNAALDDAYAAPDGHRHVAA